MGVKARTPLEKYLSLPEKYSAELIGGEIVMTPSPSSRHQRISLKLASSMMNFCVEHELGEIFIELDVHLDDDNVIRPDILYVSDESKVKENWIEGAPDVVVEILSPATKQRDMTIKRDLYERFGVKEYWVVDPESEEIIVFCNEGGRFKIACRGKECESRVLKGFKWGFEG